MLFVKKCTASLVDNQYSAAYSLASEMSGYEGIISDFLIKVCWSDKPPIMHY